MARSAPPSDDGSPARLIATMVGIVGILLLGSLAWSAVGALLSAIGAAGAALTSAAAPRPVATFETVVAVTSTPLPVAQAATVVQATPTVVDTPSDTPAETPTALATPAPTTTPRPVASPSPSVVAAAGRNPWILLPQPEPGAKVAPGTVTVEARGRGDAPITAIGIELDGGALPVHLEQRSDSTWRGVASAHVSAGSHSVRATVTDAAGRTGSYRWSFTAATAGSGP